MPRIIGPGISGVVTASRDVLKAGMRRVSASASSNSLSTNIEWPSPSFADSIDPKNSVPDEDLKRIARAMGCAVEDLTAYPNLHNPSQHSKQYITAKGLTIPAYRRTPFMDWRVKMPPATLKSRKSKLAYRHPIGLDQAFKEALGVIEGDRQQKYDKVLKMQDRIDTILQHYNVSRIDQIPDQKARGEAYLASIDIEKLRITAEINNPEVIHQFNSGNSDMKFPVYRHLARQKWEQDDRLLLMDRLESMKVIPDTLATFYPHVDLKIRFPGTTSHWIDPGRIMSTGVTAQAPEFSIQIFEDKPKLYTIVILDPDTPDLENDSYKHTLHYILADVKITGNEPLVDKSLARELVPYLPPHPEKNSGFHRYVVWVFEQPGGERLAVQQRKGKGQIDIDSLLERDGFDIRLFRSAHGLKAVGAHFWRNGYDSKTDGVREKFGLGPGNVYTHKRFQHYEDYRG
ncbi:phosphatidylethanolamine-binding protein [Lipomyces kononenkoae]|uniref:Phosphatidylethanolamine-binding protein n=1 Tax=Lipomyces kononenkoae TaxID=34357 RepID=A0ACC3SU45_LIPKO